MIEKRKLTWWPESCDLLWNREQSGSLIRRVTCAPVCSTNVYCEQPYCSADGNRVAIHRFDASRVPYPDSNLLVYDITTYRLAHLESDIIGIANAAWSGILFVTVGHGDDAKLVRHDLNTLTREELFPIAELPAPYLMSISADSRYGLTFARIRGGEQKFGLYRVELSTGRHELIYDGPYLANPHLQYRLHNASRILVLENRGCMIDDEDTLVRAFDERGAGHFTIAADGSNRRDFPVARPYTPGSTGHMCWVGDSDHVVLTLSQVWNDGARTGNVVEVSHDWEKARVIFETDKVWNHISASQCGRYFVVDSYQIEGVPIAIGSVASGKLRVLCDSKTSGSGAQHNHAHPYITGDNKYVVYVSDCTGVPQVYIASIPEGFLESLD